MPSARAERAMAPRFSGSLSPSSTAMRRAPAIASAIDGSGRRSAAATAPRCRSKPTVAASTDPRRHEHRGVEGVEASGEAGEDLRRDEHGTDPVPRLEQPLDRRDALGDEHLVALAPASGRGIGQLEVVGEAGIGGVVDGHGHGRSLTGLTGG